MQGKNPAPATSKNKTMYMNMNGMRYSVAFLDAARPDELSTLIPPGSRRRLAR